MVLHFREIDTMSARRGFTLVELLIVVLVLAILAAVAVPRLGGLAEQATDSGLRQTLAVIRKAIQRYSIDNGGALPGASNGNSGRFKTDLAPYLRDEFPAGPIGPAKGDRRVRMKNLGDPLDGGSNPGRAWRYDYTTGEFIYNWNGVSSDGVTRYEEF